MPRRARVTRTRETLAEDRKCAATLSSAASTCQGTEKTTMTARAVESGLYRTNPWAYRRRTRFRSRA
jgi:hypothetical protein